MAGRRRAGVPAAGAGIDGSAARPAPNAAAAGAEASRAAVLERQFRLGRRLPPGQLLLDQRRPGRCRPCPPAPGPSAGRAAIRTGAVWSLSNRPSRGVASRIDLSTICRNSASNCWAAALRAAGSLRLGLALERRQAIDVEDGGSDGGRVHGSYGGSHRTPAGRSANRPAKSAHQMISRSARSAPAIFMA